MSQRLSSDKLPLSREGEENWRGKKTGMGMTGTDLQDGDVGEGAGWRTPCGWGNSLRAGAGMVGPKWA